MERVMADFSDVPTLTRQPGPSVLEIFSKDTRPVPEILREERNDYLDDNKGRELDRER
jgi:hypothetical protein